MQLTAKEARRLGLIADQPCKRAIPRAGRAERTGLTTLIRAGWSVQSPDSIRYRLYKINQPTYDTGLCVDELAACNAAKGLEQAR